MTVCADPVEVRFIEAADPLRLREWDRLLSPKERDRAARFRSAGDRAVYTAVHGALRELLGGLIGADPASLRFRTERGGRPVLEGDGPQFSISRAKGAALVAVSAGGPVGADIELIAPRRFDDAVAKRFFAPAERRMLEGLPREDRTRAFFRIWTRKEALLKAQGKGIDAGLSRLDTTTDLPRWTLLSLDLPAPYAGAVAAAGDGRAIMAPRPYL
jgi:4'-phosphopantetheinyl transferase